MKFFFALTVVATVFHIAFSLTGDPSWALGAIYWWVIAVGHFVITIVERNVESTEAMILRRLDQMEDRRG